MSSSRPARQPEWKDRSFARTSSRSDIRLQTLFSQTPEELDRMRLALLTGKPVDPSYPKILATKIDEKSAIMDDFESSGLVLQGLFTDCFKHRRSLIRVARAAESGDMKEFHRANNALDLDADVGTFRRMLWSLRERIAVRPSAAADSLASRLPLDKAWTPFSGISRLLEELIEPVKAIVVGLNLPPRPSSNEVWSASRIANALQSSLVAGKFDDRFEMRVVLSDTAHTSTVNKNGTITIPSSYQLNGDDAYVLMVRLRLSVQRYYSGYRTDYYVLWNGTVCDLAAGPGVLNVVEQVLREHTTRYPGDDGYLACALAAGHHIGSTAPYDIYETMVAYYRFVDTELPQGSPKPALAEDRAWNMIWDIFGGTDFKSPRVFLGLRTRATKGTLSLLTAMAHDPRIIQYCTLGRFDPGSQAEVGQLVSVGIIPALS